MNVISRDTLIRFWQEHPDAERQLAAWFRVARNASWAGWAEVQLAYPRASLFECCLIFNICGNAYRLVVRRSQSWKTLFVIGVYTHTVYDQDHWKDRCHDGPGSRRRGGSHGRQGRS
jgi:mRNA interferase HigB